MDRIERVARAIAWSHGYLPEKLTVDELRNLPIGGGAACGCTKNATTDLFSIANTVIAEANS